MNPITAARVSAGLSKMEFGRRLKLSRTFILRAEEGCYSNPGSKLIEFSTKTLGISNTEFKRQYTRFQSFTRKQAILKLHNLEPLSIQNRASWDDLKSISPVGEVTNSEVDLELISDDVNRVKVHSLFKKWRENYWGTYIGFSKALCVHPASVENYENGNYDSMPELMIDALNEVGLIDSSFDPRLEFVYVYGEAQIK